MLTAIILTTALVIAVVIYSIMRTSGRCSRREERESIEWARKWNEARQHDICDNDCLWCDNNQFCKVKDGA